MTTAPRPTETPRYFSDRVLAMWLRQSKPRENEIVRRHFNAKRSGK